MSQQDFAKVMGQQSMNDREPESWAVPSNAEHVYEKTVLQRKRDRQSHRRGRRGSLKDYEQNTDQAWINRSMNIIDCHQPVSFVSNRALFQSKLSIR